MTDHYSGLCEALSRIASAPSPNVIWSNLREFVARFGYSYILGVDAAKIVGGIRQSAFYSDAPTELLAGIDRELNLEQHPYVERALRSSIPFTVSELRRDPNLTDHRWTEHLADTVKNGDGLVVPVYRDHELLAGFVFGGLNANTSAIARSTLQVIAHAAFEKFTSLRDRTSPLSLPSLSVRETQCLRYIASGHEDAQISQLLGISPRTVRFHVDSAKTKLGVGSRVQAVAKALREHIIAV